MAERRSTQSIDPGFAVEAEVRGNILSQQVGFGTVADLNLPSDFVGRVADRAIRESYNERHRAVAGDAAVPEPGSAPISRGPWAQLSERAPALASFRSPELDGIEIAATRLNGALPDGAAQHWDVEPRRIVRQRLAKDGLLPTIARVVLHLGPKTFVQCEDEQLVRLAGFGIPTDLLRFFVLDGVEPTPRAVVEHIAQEFVAGTRIEKVEKVLRRARFVPVAALPGFRPTSESGADYTRLVRLHLARDQFFQGPGDGGALDLCENVLREFGSCDVAISVWQGHKTKAHELAAANAGSRRIVVLPQETTLSQWAGDNAKAGSVLNEAGARVPAQVTPRYAARREDAPIFMPGDDFAVCQASNPAIVSKRSPWLFEGGNVMVCDDLQRGDRVLLVGEAEVYRNMALGLTREQVHEAFKAEFAADRCVVLPAVSYHIDQEIAVRSVPGGRTMAFVPDTRAGVRIVVRACLTHLTKVNRWPHEMVHNALAALETDQLRECLTLTWELLARERGADGVWTSEFAQALSINAVDSGMGNLHRFLLAVDHLAAEAADAAEFSEGHFRAVVRSFVRRDQDRRSLRSRLEGLGWSVVPVPALVEDSRGVNPLNGVHESGRWLMPSYGGLLSDLDRQARAAFMTSMAPLGLGVFTLPSGESQRRQGALHCSVSVFGW